MGRHVRGTGDYAHGPLFARPLFDPAELCNADEIAVASALGRGIDGARQVRDLAEATGIPARRVQEIVDHLITHHRVPIGSSMRRPYGNYLIVDREDLAETVDLLTTRGLSSLTRAAALKGMAVEDYIRRVQTRLGLEGDAA